MQKGNKKALMIVLLFSFGVVGATTLVYRGVTKSGSRKSGKQMERFGQFLNDKSMQDAMDTAATPDEIRRSQAARGAGQFSDANYGEGSLSFVKGSAPGDKGKGDGASGDDVAAGKGGKAGGKSGSNILANMDKQKGKFGFEKGGKLGGSGGSPFQFGGGAGGQGPKGGADFSKATSLPGGSVSGTQGGNTGRAQRTSRMGVSKRSSGRKGKRGGIKDLKDRIAASFGFGSSGGFDTAGAAGDIAFAGKGAAAGIAGGSDIANPLAASDISRGASGSGASTPDTPPGGEGPGFQGAGCAGYFCWEAAMCQAMEDKDCLKGKFNKDTYQDDVVGTWSNLPEDAQTLYGGCATRDNYCSEQFGPSGYVYCVQGRCSPTDAPPEE